MLGLFLRAPAPNITVRGSAPCGTPALTGALPPCTPEGVRYVLFLVSLRSSAGLEVADLGSRDAGEASPTNPLRRGPALGNLTVCGKDVNNRGRPNLRLGAVTGARKNTRH